MSHEISSIQNEEGDAFFVGSAAWHGLGTVLDSPPTVQRAIELAGLDWEPQLCPMTATIEVPKMHGITQVEVPVPDKFAVLRNDNLGVIGTVGKKYKTLSNRKAFTFFNPFLEDGSANLEAAGCLHNGSKVWVLAKLTDQEGLIQQDDAVEAYLLLFNSHDGTTSVGIMFTPVRVVCQNTLSAALSRSGKKNSQIIKVSHTASLEASLAMVQNVIDTATADFNINLEQYRQMRDFKIDLDGLVQYATAAILPGKTEVDKDNLPRVISSVVEAYETGIGTELFGEEQNLWRGYNAVTEFVDHKRGRNENSRLHASWFGVGAEIRDRAHNIALEMVAGKL